LKAAGASEGPTITYFQTKPDGSVVEVTEYLVGRQTVRNERIVSGPTADPSTPKSSPWKRAGLVAVIAVGTVLIGKAVF